jgi:hypothetical protein
MFLANDFSCLMKKSFFLPLWALLHYLLPSTVCLPACLAGGRRAVCLSAFLRACLPAGGLAAALLCGGGRRTAAIVFFSKGGLGG